MYVIEQLKLNRFRQVNLPRPREYFQRFGLVAVAPSAYSGDADTSFLSSGNKVDTIAKMDALDRARQKQEDYEAWTKANASSANAEDKPSE